MWNSSVLLEISHALKEDWCTLCCIWDWKFPITVTMLSGANWTVLHSSDQSIVAVIRGFQSEIKQKTFQVMASFQQWKRILHLWILRFFILDKHPSIFHTRLIRRSGRGGAGAYPSGHWGGVHPGQVASPSQSHTETNETNNHTHS